MSQIPPHYVRDSQGNYHHPSRVVGGLLPTKPKPEPLPALDRKAQNRGRSKGSVVVRVTIIRCGSRLLDDDNLCFAYKPLRDSIATSLGIDDGDKRISFEYGQCETKGKRGTIVKLERT